MNLNEMRRKFQQEKQKIQTTLAEQNIEQIPPKESYDLSTLEGCKKGAYAGNSEAQYTLAVRYEIGNGVDQDYNQAFQWYLKAGEQGHVDAEYKVGYYYESMLEKPNTDEAINWYLKAANAYHVNAQKALADLLYKEEQYDQAFQWYLNAADQGIAEAAFMVGVYYQELLTEKDMNEAIKWYTKAADNGYTQAQMKLGELCYEEKQFEQGFQWYLKAAKQGVDRAEYYVGYYFQYLSQEPDNTKAINWYTRSAEQGNATAQNALGELYYFNDQYEQAANWLELAAGQQITSAMNMSVVMYKNGWYYSQDYHKAFQFFQQSANLGDSTGQRLLGFLYLEGLGVKKNASKAFQLFTKSAKQGDQWSQLQLGSMYEAGEGTEENYRAALKWYKQSSDQGNTDAPRNIGIIYEEGKGVEKDYKAALKWFNLAKERGNNQVEDDIDRTCTKQKADIIIGQYQTQYRQESMYVPDEPTYSFDATEDILTPVGIAAGGGAFPLIFSFMMHMLAWMAYLFTFTLWDPRETTWGWITTVFTYTLYAMGIGLLGGLIYGGYHYYEYNKSYNEQQKLHDDAVSFNKQLENRLEAEMQKELNDIGINDPQVSVV